MTRVVLALAAVLGLPFLGAMLGSGAGDALCNDPGSESLRCLDHAVIGAAFGFALGVGAGVVVAYWLVAPVVRARSERKMES